MNAGIFFISLCMVFAFANSSIPGGWQNVADLNSAETLKQGQKAAALVSQGMDSDYHMKLISVIKARTQVVAGMNYDFTMIIGPTECSKSENLTEQQIQECPLQKCGTPLDCKATMWVQAWTNSYKITEFNCQPGQAPC